LKHVASINSDKLSDSTDPDFELEYVDIGNVTLVDGITATERMRFDDAPSRARRLVREGDTIVSTVRTYLKAVAQIVNPPPNLVVSTGFAVLRTNDSKLVPAYLYRLAQSEPFVQAIVAHSVGVSYPAINAADIGRFHIPIPPVQEQRAIAAFLDRETARIDGLVAKKQRLIELLQEKRAALIGHAVTKGLNPNAPMKDSGIESFGQIPDHWTILSLKRLCTRVDVGIAEAATHAYCTDGVPLVRSTNVRSNRIDTGEILKIEHWFAEKNRSKYLRTGDLVTVRTGYPGTTAVIPPELDNSQCFTLVMSTLRKEHNPYFF
jgi:type I restriction enzyme S subunit